MVNNQGRKLENFNIVRQFEMIGRWDGSPASWTIAANRLQPTQGVAVLVQRVDHGAHRDTHPGAVEDDPDDDREHEPGDDPRRCGRQHDLADRLPLGGSETVAAPSDETGHGANRLFRRPHDDRQHEERQSERGGHHGGHRMRIKRDVIIGRDPVITIALIRALNAPIKGMNTPVKGMNKKKSIWN